MADRRLKDRNWTPGDEQGHAPTWERVQIAVLMDLRDELKRLNQLLHCQNFIAIPRYLTEIRRNTTKRKRKKAPAQ